jgi:ABC-2 type transport system ATP-binding protein
VSETPEALKLMKPIVEAKSLHKQYKPPDGIVAVKDVSFEIGEGEIFSLLGPNGAGKTTTISMISGLLAPTRGDVLVAGHSIRRDPIKAKRALGIVPDEIALYREISARENLAFWGRMYGLGGQTLKERIAAVIEIVGLADRIDDKVEDFSGGMKRRLNIAAGLLHEPQVLLMDEPTVGIDPQSRRRILDTIKELNGQGLTVLYTTHYMEEAEELSHRIGIIDHGDLIALGSRAELRQLVGSHETIRIQLTSDNGNEATIKALSELPGVSRAYGENEYVVLQARDAKALLPSVVSCAGYDGAAIKSLEVQEPNLESVFLHLTGRALRD